jgi:sugar O-acyltransferase (sialic acid O-acetyltransferase NeuD family)
MHKTKKLILVGDSAFAEIAHEYFDGDTEYEVVAFAVERAYLSKERLNGLPVVALEDLAMHYDPAHHDVHVAIVYTQLNRLRARLTMQAKSMGYRLASYISPRAFVWRNAKIGEHCFIFEDNTVQPFVSIGNNVVLWSGNHIGHHSTIGDNCFISSHVVISGFCDIGQNSFLGVNSTISNNVKIGADNWIAPSIAILHDTPPQSLFRANEAEPSKITTHKFFKIREDVAQ